MPIRVFMRFRIVYQAFGAFVNRYITIDRSVYCRVGCINSTINNSYFYTSSCTTSTHLLPCDVVDRLNEIDSSEGLPHERRTASRQTMHRLFSPRFLCNSCTSYQIRLERDYLGI